MSKLAPLPPMSAKVCVLGFAILLVPTWAWGQPAPPAETQVQSSADRETGPAPVLDADAKAVVEQGIKHFQAKEFPKAAQAFTAAARRYPNNAELRHLLGVAMFQNKQPEQAWLQFRKAVQLNPGLPNAARDFLGMWSVFDQRGVFNIGRSTEDIAKLIGNPDSKMGSEVKQVWVYGFMRLHFNDGRLFAIIDPRGLNPETSRPVDAMKIEFDDKTRWRLAYRVINRFQSLTEYVPKEQTVQKWEELYSVQRLYPDNNEKKPRDMMVEIEANLKKMNPDIDFKTLVNSENDVLFHWRDKGDAEKKRLPQHEIVRLVAGARDIHRLAYSRRIAQIPTTEARAWIDLLRNAELTQTNNSPATSSK